MSNTTIAVNTINLGPRARWIVRFVAGFVNPLVLLIAGRRWMPVVGILRHRGRRTGRMYATPIGMRPLHDGFVIPRTFSDNAAWYLNIKAAGGATAKYLGRTYQLVDPQVVDYATARPAFPRYELLQFRVIGINEYLRLRVVTSPLAGEVARSAGGGTYPQTQRRKHAWKPQSHPSRWHATSTSPSWSSPSRS
jgi:deazaflavin-dependent oxidoreductase (nitroreductase family)